LKIWIHVWSVPSRGEATVILFPNANLLHIVDFGSKNPEEHLSSNAVNEFCKVYRNAYCRCYQNIDLYITHFHYDHFSLIPFINCVKQFRNIYVPGIPIEPREVLRKALSFFALGYIILETISWRIKKSKALESIVSKSRDKQLRFLYRGMEQIINNDIKVRIVWPPQSLLDHVSDKVLKKLEEKFNQLIKELHDAGFKININELEDHVKMLEEIYLKAIEEKIPFEFSEYFVPSIIPYILPEITPNERFLISRIYDALNDFSLVLEYYYKYQPLIVIPGDNSNKILDYIKNLEILNLRANNIDLSNERKIIFLRGAHHGTYYGGYLEMFKATVTWLSNMEDRKYRREYWEKACIVLPARYYTGAELMISIPKYLLFLLTKGNKENHCLKIIHTSMDSYIQII